MGFYVGCCAWVLLLSFGGESRYADRFSCGVLCLLLQGINLCGTCAVSLLAVVAF